MSTGYAACYIRTIFPNQLNPSNFVSSADCFVTVCMMETAAVVDGILNWKWKLEHENLTNLSELLSHLVAFLSSEAFDIKKQHRMINYLPNAFGKQNVNSTCIHTYSYRAISHSGKWQGFFHYVLLPKLPGKCYWKGGWQKLRRFFFHDFI